MHLRYAIGAASIFVAAIAACNRSVASPEAIGCSSPHDPTVAAQPIGTGPLTLAKFYCLDVPSSGVPISPPVPSPDERAFFAFDSIKGLWLADTDSRSSPRNIAGGVTGALSLPDRVPFTWFKDSRSVLGVKQETMKPSGFALGPLRPVKFSLDGSETQLPALSHPSGPLDEIFWVGRSGLAIAAFGTKGGYYRPEHEDKAPTLAIVDAIAGKVLDTFPVKAIEGLAPRTMMGSIVSRLDERGRVNALINFPPRKWIWWVQGEAPRSVPLGASELYTTQFAVSPDGRSVLVMKNLSANGVICELDPNCPPPTPSTGAIAELREISTGKLIWSVTGTANRFSSSDRPAISPDGRYALISMPEADRGPTTALVSMQSGRVLQQIPDPWTSECAVGFSQDSKIAWISGGSALVTYRVGS